MMKVILLLIISAAQLIPLSAQIIHTEFGQVEGATNGTVKQFLGIPFAKPPVADLRWKAPQNPDNWTGTILTQDFAPVCPQKNFSQGGTSSTIVGDEDCLYLNVWTPQTNTDANLPVMVFVHGGGNQQGGASEVNGGTEMFFGKNLSERGNVVVVTIQYRLGPLGFLVHPGLAAENGNHVSGNYAVLDQILALQWVQHNISNFGGNPDNVTIFGESAGGLNVANLLTTPLANGLFHRAIVESATPIIGNYDTLSNHGIAYVNTHTTSGTDEEKIAFMRNVSPEVLVANEEPPISGGAVGMNWQAAVDQVVFFDDALTTIQSGNFNHVPIIVGSNAEEMSLSAPSTVYPFMVNALISQLPSEFQEEATILYPPGSGMSDTLLAKQSYIAFLTDAQFTATSRRFAQCVSQNQTEPVYRYFFTQHHTLKALQSMGSYHGMELFYVFNTWENATLGSGVLFKPADDSTQQVMLQYWTNFAGTGDPNDGTLADWQAYNAATDCYMQLKATPNGTSCGLRTATSDFWDKVADFKGCATAVAIAENDKQLTPFHCLPNPSTGLFELMLTDEIQDFDVTIHNLMGQKIYTSKNTRQIDLTNQNPGIYFVAVKVKGQTLNNKIIKTN